METRPAIREVQHVLLVLTLHLHRKRTRRHQYLCYKCGNWTVKRLNVFTKICFSAEEKKYGHKCSVIFQISAACFTRPAWDAGLGAKSLFSKKFYSEPHSLLCYSEKTFSTSVSMFSPINGKGHFVLVLHNPAKESGDSIYQERQQDG